MNTQMHWQAMIERVWRCTWKPRSCELRDALGGHDRSRLEEYLEEVDVEVIKLKAINLEAANQEVADREACVMETATLFIG
jgi:hypothetical protein